MLKSVDFMYDHGQYIKDGHGEETETVAYNKLKSKHLDELIDIFSNSTEEMERRVAKLLILKRLEIVDLDRFQYALDEVIGTIKTTNKTLKELGKITKNHKHKTFGAGYSEKPAW